jgi:cobalamin synthase
VNAASLSLRATGPLAPLAGILVGALGGAIYWLAAQLFPSSVAVILSMAATALVTTNLHAAAATRLDLLGRVLLLFIKYNALMALSAAKLPFDAPANFPLVLIMICGYAASFALQIFLMAARPQKSAAKIGHGTLILTLGIGFAPAALLGIPGLIGLAAALIAGLGLMAFLRHKNIPGVEDGRDLTQLSTEACFYLGALASWRFI